MLSYVYVAALRWADSPSNECYGPEKATKAQQGAVEQ
jgi:hypothetical protein